MRTIAALSFLVFAFVASATHAASPSPDSVEFFESKIRPVLVQHCYECHSAEAAAKNKLKGGLLLDSRDAMRRGGDSGEAVVAGKPDEGQLLASLRYDGDYQMPPKGKLPAETIADFEAWIRSGAVDPRDTSAPIAAETTIDWNAARQHWSFQPPRDVAPPSVKRADWPQTAIDQFILAELEARELEPVALADARTLARRLYFDLIGLPPTPEQMEAFIAAYAADRRGAVTQLVEQLLETPHYGERWARHWLDVARYAHDQAHTFGVKPKTSAYQYRDWVIEALNNDLPYDQFIKQQLAGDLLPSAPNFRGDIYAAAKTKPQPEAFARLAGLGFLGLGAEYYKNSDKARAEADELDDRIDTVTRGFLALTVSCARCHDHKFDPIPTHDYYALAGIFSGSSLGEAPLAATEEVEAFNQAQARIKQQDETIKEWLLQHQRERGRQEASQAASYVVASWRIASLKRAQTKYSVDVIAKELNVPRYFLVRWSQYLPDLAADKRPELLKAWYDAPRPDAATKYAEVAVPAEVEQAAQAFQAELIAAMQEYVDHDAEFERQRAEAANDEARRKIKRRKLEPAREALLKTFWLDDQAPLALNAGEFEKSFLTDADKPELNELRAELERRKQAAPPSYAAAPVLKGGGQAMQIFVRGNPAVKGDWAARGFLQVLTNEPPITDPKLAQSRQFTRVELAEAIASPQNPLTARVIVNRVWKTHFGRGLVETASNFGRSGDAPSHPQLLDWLALRFMENGWSLKWLHRQMLNSTTYQLASENSARNLEKDGGNRYYWRMERRRLDVEAWRDTLLQVAGNLDSTLGGPAFDLSDANIKRRTVYARISRHDLDGLLRLFDFPDANVTADQRTVTTVPQQQLFVLNSDFMIGQAKTFAARLQAAAANDEERVRLAYQLAYHRLPTAPEQEFALEFLSAAPHPEDKLTPWEQYAQAILAANEMLYVD